MKINLLSAYALASLLGLQAYAQTVDVVCKDENGLPVPDAEVWVEFLIYPNEQSPQTKGRTDNKGRFMATSPIEDVVAIFLIIRKPGYYDFGSHAGVGGRHRLILSGKRNHHVQATLRQIRNPIPLHERRFMGWQLQPPIANKFFGFDLEKGDWVQPHGKGVVADFELLHSPEKRDGGWMLQLRLRFPEHCGIHRVVNDYLPYSKMVLPHEAPLHADYSRQLVLTQAVGTKLVENSPPPVSERLQPLSGYFLRTRVIVDDAGEIVSANYAKIPREFTLGGECPPVSIHV